jgi:transcriptional regulator with XRE-family HTH domain
MFIFGNIVVLYAIFKRMSSMTEKKKDVGERIKKAREARGLKQKELADILDMNRSNISRMESGYVMPKIDTLLKIKDTLHISIDWLLTGQGVMESLGTFGEYHEDIREMLENMQKHRRVKHAVLEFYLTYMAKEIKIKNKNKAKKGNENTEEDNNG